MKAKRIFDLNHEHVSSILNREPEISSEIEIEKEEGVDTTNFPITSFKVEQRLMNITKDSSLSIGGFANGRNNVKRLKTRYIMAFYSDKFKTSEDGSIKRRYGYGFEFTLNVTDIQTKLALNFGALSASNSLGLATVGYNTSVYGVEDLSLLDHLSAKQGSFDYSAYQELSNFMNAAKEELASQEITKLYPIEILQPSDIELENSDVESIYFSVKQIIDEKTLEETLEKARDLNSLKINENVVKYIYKYFKLRTAYTPPNRTQVQNAQNWISGSYNRISELNRSNNWISIDVTLNEEGNYESDLGIPNSSDYQPHQVPDNWHSLGHQLRILKDQVSLENSSTIKLLSTFDSELNFNSITFFRDVALFTEVSEGTAGSEVVETMCGIGVRFKIFVSNIEFGTDISFNTIGAASDMGHANVEFQISGIGIPDSEILKVLPGPLNISQDSMTDLNKLIKIIETRLSNMDASQFQPQPFAIRVTDSQEIDPTLNAQATVFSVAKVKDGLTLEKAINAGKKLGISEEVIKDTYKIKFGITDQNEEIKGKNFYRGYFGKRADARDWFQKFD